MTAISKLPSSAVHPPNKTLDGHLLLITGPKAPTQAWLDRIHALYPGLRVLYRELHWGQKLAADALTATDWHDVTVLLTTGGTLPPDPAAVPKLQYVQLFSAGANLIIKQPLFTDTDVAFCTANGVHGPQITEWIIATYLAFNHNLPSYLEYQREGKWNRLTDETDDVPGQRVGILGYGSIGRQTARVATALGMEVYAYTLHPRDTPASRRDDGYAPPGTGDPEGVFPTRWFSGGSKEDVRAFLGSGIDLLVVATPLTDSTTHLLGAEELRLLGRTDAEGRRRAGFVSNIARGPVVDTDALIAALESGELRGAALDVTDPEPLPEGHPLWHTKNVIITPHISGGSARYTERVLAILEDNLGRLSTGRPLVNRVSRKEGY
ncbi:D-isomer specific 2-hydroxyacid dehydrogenase [Niveomyces insectorum RCEF 264]|uniref:D-isomer specific 2-hydroxyacid dehydrogenase n=1 Tax=Niveomyces insectorum RCEF 264 TaxID=1081102 RepID=A0A167XZM1_9HYPO|nr:D-isomer specific 2-hydroxyacid dehydrogenase [Niveomyces insectorum RCEF 264]